MISLLCADPYNEIIPGLHIGGHDIQNDESRWSQSVIIGDEFDLVISLYARDGHGPAADTLHVFHRLPDGPLERPALADVRVLADWAAEHIRAGKRVLCREDAIALIRQRRSRQALFNTHFRQYIADEAARLAGGA